jgi:hypothetical protein
MRRWLKIIYSFHGEIKRWEFWVGWSLSLVPVGVLAKLLEVNGIVEGPLLLLLYVLIFWPLAALAVKRARARNRPLWWLWFGLIPYVGTAWFIWEFAGRPGRVPGPAPQGLLASFRHARTVNNQLPEVIQLKKTADLPVVSEEDIFASGVHEELSRELGSLEREKHVYKGTDPGAFLGTTKGFPLCFFMVMNKGLVVLDKGPQTLTAGKFFEIVLDKVSGGLAGGIIPGAIAGLATGVVSSLSQQSEDERELSKTLADFKSRPGTFIIPYTEIIEARHHKHSFADQLLHIKRETPEGRIEEYWLRPTHRQYPFLLFSLRAKAEQDLIRDQLVAERAKTSQWLPQMLEEFRTRHPGGGTEADLKAFQQDYGKTLMERLKANGASLFELILEAERRTLSTFASTPVFAIAEAIRSPQAAAGGRPVLQPGA